MLKTVAVLKESTRAREGMLSVQPFADQAHEGRLGDGQLQRTGVAE